MSITDGKPPAGYEVWDASARPYKLLKRKKAHDESSDALLEEASSACDDYAVDHPDARLVEIPMGSGCSSRSILDELTLLDDLLSVREYRALEEDE